MQTELDKGEDRPLCMAHFHCLLLTQLKRLGKPRAAIGPVLLPGALCSTDHNATDKLYIMQPPELVSSAPNTIAAKNFG